MPFRQTACWETWASKSTKPTKHTHSSDIPFIHTLQYVKLVCQNFKVVMFPAFQQLLCEIKVYTSPVVFSVCVWKHYRTNQKTSTLWSSVIYSALYCRVGLPVWPGVKCFALEVITQRHVWITPAVTGPKTLPKNKNSSSCCPDASQGFGVENTSRR